MTGAGKSEHTEAMSSLKEALEKRSTIATAVGILMERYTTDYDGAVEMLVVAAHRSEAEVFALASQLVERGWAGTL